MAVIFIMRYLTKLKAVIELSCLIQISGERKVCRLTYIKCNHCSDAFLLCGIYFLYQNTHCIYKEKETTLNNPVLRRIFIKPCNLEIQSCL